MKKTPVANAAKKYTQDLMVDMEDDAFYLSKTNEGWSDLNELKDALAHTLLGFVFQVERITNSPEILSCLGGKVDEYQRLLNVFYADITRFSDVIQTLRVEHQDKHGTVASMEDLNTFTRLAMQYQQLQIELQSLLSPTLASLVLLIHEVAPSGIHVPDDIQPINPVVQ